MSNLVHVLRGDPFAATGYLRRLWPVALIAAATVVGLAAGVDPSLALAAVVAAAFVPIVVLQPVVGLYLLVFLSFLESFSGIAGSVSLTKVVGLLIVLGWVATTATASPQERAERSLFAREPLLTAALVLFAAWTAVSMVWAEQPDEGADAFARFALNFILFPIVLAAVREPRHVVWLFGVFVAAALTTVGLALMGTSVAPSVEGRLSGVGVNPNQLGALLIVAAVLAVGLATIRTWLLPARATALAAAALAVVGLLMTQSRGALVGLGVALLVAPLAVGRGRRAAAAALAVAAIVGTVGWFAAVAPESAGERVTQITQQGGSGREDLWRIGWRMVEDHPMRGVGAGNFRVSSIHYHLRPGRTERDELIVDTPKSPHNIYLTVLSELGIVGLVLFTTILAWTLGCAVRAARAFARQGRQTMELLTRTLVIGLVGYLAALFFSSQIYEKQLWLLLATAPALLVIAERGARDESARLAHVTRLRAVDGSAGG